jgi:3-oxoadipate enol-lactonase
MKQTIDGLEIAYEIHGTTGPWVTFSHSLGCSRQMWRGQIDALSNTYRVLAYDLRGHGESGRAQPLARSRCTPRTSSR